MKEYGFDFNDLFILECFYENNDKQYFNMFNIPSIEDFNLSSRYQFLKKNEYLVEDPNDSSKIIISKKGIDFLEHVNTSDTNVPGVGGESFTITLSQDFFGNKKSEDECFEEWWKVFPTTTAWQSDDKVTKFTGSRALKNLRKADAKKRYFKLLNQGLKHEELVGGLKYEIKMKKLDSIKKSENQMDYFKGMESYFNSERYMLYIESYINNPDFVADETTKSKAKNVTDI